MSLTAATLIAQSIAHSTIAHAPATLALIADLTAKCDDSVINRLPGEDGERIVREFWGTDDGAEWRVHIEGDVSPEAERVVRDLARQDRDGETGGRKPSTVETLREWQRAGGQAGDLMTCAAIDALDETRAAEIYDSVNPVQ